ncbi:MAG: diadenylate cyclase CdaA [Anaerolineales bacterium]|nr:diadenylate cyclase CdaA [Anaerolineales bacterium]MCS7246955.1 diadenylate cyclase CdaA [Anaerolineales bacterium]MDW8160766.1 diadenylate cyclase CdaA [Anaerolineales bacterium]MDW8447689.1 diadenylate cyclase CdaA [Anaerolineales bacterium]
MADLLSNFIDNILFVLQRITWLSIIDLLLVTIIFFLVLRLIQDTQGIILIRGAIFLIVIVALLSSLEVLPAFSWMVRNTLPAMLIAIPVIFAPEIRRTLERLGRASTLIAASQAKSGTSQVIKSVVNACARLSERRHGALIVFQRLDRLDEYIESGVRLNAKVSPELLLQIFYPNTPLHDGAVIITNETLLAAACVLPLSSSGVLSESPERQMGLRHRAALGVSEISDAVAVVVSEETGSISIADSGRMIRRINPNRLELILKALLYIPSTENRLIALLRRFTGVGQSEERL